FGADPGAPRTGPTAASPGGAVPHRSPQRPARAGAYTSQHSLREVWWPEVSRVGAHQGRYGYAARARKPARPGQLVPRAAAPGRHRPGRRAFDPDRAQRLGYAVRGLARTGRFRAP